MASGNRSIIREAEAFSNFRALSSFGLSNEWDQLVSGKEKTRAGCLYLRNKRKRIGTVRSIRMGLRCLDKAAATLVNENPGMRKSELAGVEINGQVLDPKHDSPTVHIAASARSPGDLQPMLDPPATGLSIDITLLSKHVRSAKEPLTMATCMDSVSRSLPKSQEPLRFP